MIFEYKKAWFVPISTAVDTVDLLVDTGAGISCVSVTDLARLFGKSETELLDLFKYSAPATKKMIDGTEVKLYPFCIPKVSIGGLHFQNFYCLVSLNVNFQSVLGLDVLRHGITHLQFKSKGDCDPFDFIGYEREHSKLPYNKLAFLDYD